MGLKNDRWIRQQAAAGMIEPFAEGGKRPGVVSYGLSSYGFDFRLAPEFVVPHGGDGDGGAVLDPKAAVPGAPKTAPSFDIPAGSVVLGRSLEYFRIPRGILTLCQGKSTYARLGLLVNVTPFEPGWEGHATLCLLNGGRAAVRVHAGEGIAQLLFVEGDEPPQMSYADRGGKYQASAGVTAAKVDR